MVINDDGVHLTYHQSRAELGPMPSWVVWMVTGRSLGRLWGVAGDKERVGPCFDVLADVKSGAVGLVVAQ